MRRAFLGKDGDMSNRQVLVLVLPPVFAMATVVLIVIGLWWAGLVVAVLGVGVTMWALRARSNEEADQAIAAAALFNGDQDSSGDGATDSDAEPLPKPGK